MSISKITLGTAQLGLNYGITNIYGKPSIDKSLKILNYAWENGINAFDTSPLYGDSEKIIGTFITSKIENENKKPIIISKLPKVELKGNITYEKLYKHITKQIISSLNNLELEKIPIYLLHHPSDIFLEDGLVFECLNQIKNDGLIDRFGTSVYNPNEVEATLNCKESNVIQVPINIFDHRLIKSGLLKKLKEEKYLILARSVYLQGLFFTHLDKLREKKLEIAKKPLLKLHNLMNEYKISVEQIAFIFVRDLSEITSMVIGAEKIEQVTQNLKLIYEEPLDIELRKRILEELSDISEKIINPSLWNK